MRHKLAQTAVALSLILTIGGHWFVLQSVAWVGMFARFSQTCSVSEALVKTFSGKNPCKICIVVQEGKKSEEKQDSVKMETKLDLFVTDRQLFWVQPAGESFEPSLVFSDPAPERFLPPPTPPPRAV